MLRYIAFTVRLSRSTIYCNKLLVLSGVGPYKNFKFVDPQLPIPLLYYDLNVRNMKYDFVDIKRTLHSHEEKLTPKNKKLR